MFKTTFALLIAISFGFHTNTAEARPKPIPNCAPGNVLQLKSNGAVWKRLSDGNYSKASKCFRNVTCPVGEKLTSVGRANAVAALFRCQAPKSICNGRLVLKAGDLAYFNSKMSGYRKSNQGNCYNKVQCPGGNLVELKPSVQQCQPGCRKGTKVDPTGKRCISDVATIVCKTSINANFGDLVQKRKTAPFAYFIGSAENCSLKINCKGQLVNQKPGVARCEPVCSSGTSVDPSGRSCIKACTKILKPVCASQHSPKNTRTFDNGCIANKAGWGVIHEGACKTSSLPKLCGALQNLVNQANKENEKSLSKALDSVHKFNCFQPKLAPSYTK